VFTFRLFIDMNNNDLLHDLSQDTTNQDASGEQRMIMSLQTQHLRIESLERNNLYINFVLLQRF